MFIRAKPDSVKFGYEFIAFKVEYINSIFSKFLTLPRDY